MTQPTARSALNHLKSIGVLAEVSGKKRDKVYIYRTVLFIKTGSLNRLNKKLKQLEEALKMGKSLLKHLKEI